MGTIENYVQNSSTKSQVKDLIGRPNQRIQIGYLNAHERLGACSLRLENNPIKRQASLNTVMNIPAPFNTLNAELNPICYLLALLGAHHFLHVSRIRVKSFTLRLLMSYIYIYGAPILDISRSHTTTQHSR